MSGRARRVREPRIIDIPLSRGILDSRDCINCPFINRGNEPSKIKRISIIEIYILFSLCTVSVCRCERGVLLLLKSVLCSGSRDYLGLEKEKERDVVRDCVCPISGSL